MKLSSSALFEELVSKPRLDSYRQYFRVGMEEAIGLYIWNMEVASCFSSLLGFFEVALRNHVHGALSTHYSQGASKSIHWYDIIAAQLKKTTRDKVYELRHQKIKSGGFIPKVPQPSPDEIVSRVTFGFWPSVLSCVNSAHASKIFPAIFPEHALNSNPIDWSIDVKRKQALAYLYEFTEFRNRIAHHEPLWKFSELIDGYAKPKQRLFNQSLSKADSVIRLKRLLVLLDAGMGSLDKKLQEDLKDSTWRYRLEYAVSDRGFDRYLNHKHFPMESVSPSLFRKDFPLIVRENRPVVISKSSGKGTFIPE